MRHRDPLGRFVKDDFNEHFIDGDIVYILMDFHVATVDIQDLEKINSYKWYVQYARRATKTNKSYCRVITNINGKSKKMHRFILSAFTGQIIDHIDQNPLNNCRNNLRIVTASQNQRNRNAKITSSSRFKGCYLDKKRNKWVAQIKIGKKIKHLGRFNHENDAYSAYQEAELKYLGITT